MTKVKLLTSRISTRHGFQAVGDVIEVDDDEARRMVDRPQPQATYLEKPAKPAKPQATAPAANDPAPAPAKQPAKQAPRAAAKKKAKKKP